ncbi:hypothetical protein TRIUR3_26280 [Triticum urartu]|uniref:Uncharacterized protein n=1 Tax=Triticum urartu TaxID=4572 RepID=M8AJF6_TRIUA|nr:hypothetical protein TRIUR3_26280 [Triticum urartu]
MAAPWSPPPSTAPATGAVAGCRPVAAPCLAVPYVFRHLAAAAWPSAHRPPLLQPWAPPARDPPSASPWFSCASSVRQGCLPAAFSCRDQDPVLAPLVTSPPHHPSRARVRVAPYLPPPRTSDHLLRQGLGKSLDSDSSRPASSTSAP